jgi:iron complex outermembrane receptor protein
MTRFPTVGPVGHRWCGNASITIATVVALCVTTGARAGDEAWLETIVVTARKLVEDAGALPLAIDVLGTNALGAARIDSLQAISEQAPGFGYEGQFGASAGVPMLRGQSQPTTAGDNVAVFIDGVYQANPDAIDIEPFDLERIELIRGPQSTLFGHSAFAGALNYVSRPPTAELSRGASIDGGTDAWFGVQGHVSGPILGSAWLGRLAGSYRRADGTLLDASSGKGFGAFEREAVAGSLARNVGSADDWTAVLGFRFGSSAAAHPAVSRLTGADYNCGSRSTTTGMWSYYCGEVPVVQSYDLSDDLPDSTSRHRQVSLRLSWPLGAMRLESDSSAYWGDARSVRDNDASDVGQLFGVCVIGRSCPVAGFPAGQVERLAYVNEVIEWPADGQEVSQELRLRGGDERFGWLFGAVWFETRQTAGSRLGAARGNLEADELYTALLPGSPQTVGPVSIINFALTENPSAVQFERFLEEWQRRTLAGYVALDWHATAELAVRAEFRHTLERFSTAFFAPNTDPEPPVQHFTFSDPRLSLDYAWNDSMHTWLSAARGSRSGGTNNLPGLEPSEQSFDPEFNWTYELGLRYANDGVLRSLAVTGYYIDWRNTQIGTWAATPGVIGFITANAPGVTTQGIEASVALQPAAWLRAEFDYSRVDARFRAGTDYPGVEAYCGLSPTSSESDICSIGPPRQPAPSGIDLVPWVDGNTLARVPQSSWHAALLLDPVPDVAGWRVGLRTDVSYQDNMYENQIESLGFGRRTLVDAQLSATRGTWTVELWARNLTDERYIRSAFENSPALFPRMPVPIDSLYGDGRRCGITLRYAE